MKKVYKYIGYPLVALIVNSIVVIVLTSLLYSFNWFYGISDYLFLVLLVIIDFILLKTIYKDNGIIPKMLGIVGVIVIVILSIIWADKYIYGDDAFAFLEVGMKIIKAQVLSMLIVVAMKIIETIKNSK